MTGRQKALGEVTNVHNCLRENPEGTEPTAIVSSPSLVNQDQMIKGNEGESIVPIHVAPLEFNALFVRKHENHRIAGLFYDTVDPLVVISNGAGV